MSFARLTSPHEAHLAVSITSAEHRAWFEAAIIPHEIALRRWLSARFPGLDADDISQESFLRILRAPAAEPVAHPKAYLFTTARNLALKRIRHDRHRAGQGEVDASEVIDDRPSIPETVARAQEHELLTEALHSLPERARQVFTLRRIYNFSLKEIAAHLNLSEKTVESHVSLALRRCTDFVKNADARVAHAGNLDRLSSATLKPVVRHV